MEDAQLLARFNTTRSEEAFRALVDRHIPMVYSVCLRQLRDPHWAEDVSQAVFILLAKKAARLKPGVILGGWLYRTAVFACSNARQLQRTRTFHETRVEIPMNNDDSHPEKPLEQAELESLLDEGLTELSPAQRDVLIQRFFENKTLHEIARLRGQSQYAVEKSLQTGLRKVRRFLAQRGVSVSLVFLSAFLARQAAAAVPTGLAAAATSAAVSGTVASSTIGVLVSQIIKAGGQTKLLTALASTVACLLLATLALAFSAAPDSPPAPRFGIASPITASHPATAAEIADLLATLHRTESALRLMDNTALAQEVAFTDSTAAGQWEKMASLFAANAALKSTAIAHFGPTAGALTAIPTFNDRLDQIIPALDPASAEFFISNNRAVCHFAYHTDVAGGAIYFLRTDNRWRIDAATTLSILLEGSIANSPRTPLEQLDDPKQQALLARIDQLNLALATVTTAINTGTITTLDDARTALHQLDTDITTRAFFTLALRRDQHEQPRF